MSEGAARLGKAKIVALEDGSEAKDFQLLNASYFEVGTEFSMTS